MDNSAIYKCFVLLFHLSGVLSEQNIPIKQVNFKKAPLPSHHIHWEKEPLAIKPASKLVCASTALKDNFEIYDFDEKTNECRFGRLLKSDECINEVDEFGVYIISHMWKGIKCDGLRAKLSPLTKASGRDETTTSFTTTTIKTTTKEWHRGLNGGAHHHTVDIG